MVKLDELTDEEKTNMAEKALLREKKLLKLIDGCSTILYRLGKVTERHVENSYTQEARVFDGYGFDIDDTGPNTMFGGNSLEIRYKGKMVLDLYYWRTAPSDPSYEVYSYSAGEWEGRLEDLINNVDEEVKKAKETEKLHAARKKEEEEQAKRLREASDSLADRSKRLGQYLK